MLLELVYPTTSTEVPALSETKRTPKLIWLDTGLVNYAAQVQKEVLDAKDLQDAWRGRIAEHVVAQELRAHGHKLFYYDNRQKGEVDFLVDDYAHLCILPVEVKSGKDYTVHSALDNLLSVPDYHVPLGLVLSNERQVVTQGKVRYLPVYYVMFLDADEAVDGDVYF